VADGDSDQLDKAAWAEENAAVAVAGRQRETRMGFARALATALFVLALPVALVTTNIRLLINAPAVYDYAFDRYDAESSTGIARAELDDVGGGLREYFRNGEKTFYQTVTEDGLPTPIFNAEETRHLEDVKSLVVKLNRAQEVSLVYVLAYVVAFFIWARDGNVRQLCGQTLVGLSLGVFAAAATGLVAVTGFDAAWDRFHDVFFANDFWQLNPRTDHLIQMFPEPFWRDMTVFLGALSAVEALLIGAASTVYLLGTRSERRQLGRSVELDSSTQAA
jgi:integral membrane protein (TIGR01906 family)